MKNTLSLLVSLLCLCCGQYGLAQNIDRLRSNINYTQFPNVKIPNNVEDYRASFLFDDHDLTTTQNRSAISKYFVVSELEYDQESDNRLVVRVDPLETGEVSTSKREEKKKDGDNEIIVTTYTANYTYAYPFEVKFSDEDGNILLRQQMEVNDTYVSQPFSTATDAEKYVEEERGTLKRKHKEDLAKKIPAKVRTYLDNTLNTIEMPIQLSFGYVKNNKWKKFTYPELEEAARLAQMASNGTHILKLGQDDQAVSDLRTAITIWEDLTKQMDLNDRKSRINKKLARILYENIAHAYFCMNEINQTISAIRKQGAVKAGMAGTSSIGQLAEDLRLRYEANGIDYN